METIPKSIWLRNCVSIRKGGRKARCAHERARVSANWGWWKKHTNGTDSVTGTLFPKHQKRSYRINRIPWRERRYDKKRIQKRPTNIEYQKCTGQKSQGNERSHSQTMRMEGWKLVVRRKNLDTRRRRPQNHYYIPMPWSSSSGTRRNSQGYGIVHKTILLAKYGRDN